MDKQITTKQHVNIGTILQVGPGKTTLTADIYKYLSSNSCLDFESLSVRIPNEFNDIDIFKEQAEQCSKNIMIKKKKFNHSNKI